MATFLINIIGFIAINIVLAYVLKEYILSVLPITISFLTLILYALCLIRRLSWIDCIFVLIIAMTIFIGFCFRKKIDWQKLQAVILEPNNLIIIAMFLFVYIIAWDRIGTEWDELGVWAIEVKTMFYTDGLSLPDMHTSIGYANYIPGQMLFEWWFCHFSPGTFYDGLMYFGYYSMYYIMIVPFIVCRNMQNKWRDLVKSLIMIPILFALPSVFCVWEYRMLSIEFLISSVFSALMYSLFDVQLHTKMYIRVRWIALSILLMLLKSDAIFFLLIVYLTAFILLYMDRKIAISEQNENCETMSRVRKNLNYGILIMGLSFSVMISLIWEIAVKYYHRSGSFSERRVLNTLKDILRNIYSGRVQFDEDKLQYIRSFIDAILHQPLHSNATNFFDLTVISCVLLIVFVLYLAYRNHGFRNGKREYFAVNCVAVGSILLFLLMLLFMYMYIFCETQYFKSSTMILSISRYAEPLFMGWSLVGLLICLNKKRTELGMLVLMLFLMCPEYVLLQNYFKSSQSNMEATREKYLQGREEFSEFFQENEDFFGISGEGRILFVCGGVNETGLSIRQFRYLTVPRSVCRLDYDDMSDFHEVIYNTAVQNACGYIYFEQVPEDVVQTCVNDYNLNPLGNYLYEISIKLNP